MNTFFNLLKHQIRVEKRQFYPHTHLISKRHVSNPVNHPVYETLIGNLNGIEIRQMEEKGRGLFSKKNMPAGSTLFEEKPYISTVNETNVKKGTYCLSCFRKTKRGHTSKCDACGSVYCSSSCQTHDFDEKHSLLCKQIEGKSFKSPLYKYCMENGRRYPLLAAKLFAKILLQSHKEQSFANNWELVQALSYATPHPDDKDVWQVLHHEYQLFSQQFLHDNPTNAQFFTFAWYVQVIGILQLNCISIDLGRTSEQKDRKLVINSDATGLYLLTSFLNHSCEPNVGIQFVDNTNLLRLVLLEDVKSSEELTLSYVETTLPHQERNSHLQTAYGFTCKCPKCIRGE